jgi:hypothetical protein
LVEIGYNPLVAPSSGGSQNLQEVTDEGNITTNEVISSNNSGVSGSSITPFGVMMNQSTGASTTTLKSTHEDGDLEVDFVDGGTNATREWVVANVSGGATDLGYTASPTNGIVTSSTGTDATLTLATGTNAGLLAPADFTKLGNQSGTNTGDQDLSGLMVKSNNLSDLTNTTTARSNLGLGTLATQSGTFTEKLTATKTLIQLTADQTNNTITLADITGFSFTLPAGKKCEVNINCGYNTSGVGVGITTNINIVTASGANANLFGILETETRLSTTTINESTYMVDQPANTTTDYESFTGVSTTGINSFSSTAMLNNLATNTDVVYKIQFRSETAGQEIKLLKGSSMTITIY